MSSPRVTAIAVSISEAVELGLVGGADDVGVGVVLFVVVIVLFVVVIFPFVGVVVVVVVVIVRVVVIPNIFRFVLFLIILLSSSLVEVGCGARLPEMFQVAARLKGCHQSLLTYHGLKGYY